MKKKCDPFSLLIEEIRPMMNEAIQSKVPVSEQLYSGMNAFVKAFGEKKKGACPSAPFVEGKKLAAVLLAYLNGYGRAEQQSSMDFDAANMHGLAFFELVNEELKRQNSSWDIFKDDKRHAPFMWVYLLVTRAGKIGDAFKVGPDAVRRQLVHLGALVLQAFVRLDDFHAPLAVAGSSDNDALSLDEIALQVKHILLNNPLTYLEAALNRLRFEVDELKFSFIPGILELRSKGKVTAVVGISSGAEKTVFSVELFGVTPKELFFLEETDRKIVWKPGQMAVVS